MRRAPEMPNQEKLFRILSYEPETETVVAERDGRHCEFWRKGTGDYRALGGITETRLVEAKELEKQFQSFITKNQKAESFPEIKKLGLSNSSIIVLSGESVPELVPRVKRYIKEKTNLDADSIFIIFLPRNSPIEAIDETIMNKLGWFRKKVAEASTPKLELIDVVRHANGLEISFLINGEKRILLRRSKDDWVLLDQIRSHLEVGGKDFEKIFQEFNAWCRDD
jgi:hypothetical protein